MSEISVNARSSDQQSTPGLYLADLISESLFRTIRDAVVVVDLGAQRVVQWNAAAERMFGYSFDEAQVLPLIDLFPESIRKGAIDALSSRLLTGPDAFPADARPIEVPMLHKTGRELCVELTVTPVDGPDTRYLIGITRDITDRKVLERELAELLADATEHASRVSELARVKEDFTAMVAHELVAPAAAISAMVELFGRDGLSGSQRADMLAMISSEALMLKRLAYDIRDVAQLERDQFAVDLQPVVISRLLADAAASADGMLGDHQFQVAPAPGGSVLADAGRIGQVLRNLLGNAAKYTPAGTAVILHARRRDGTVFIEVSDQGPGIDAADRERMFTKFGRGRDAEGRRLPGTGLGLYLSRRIALAHGGDLVVTSEPGMGSTFSLSLKEVLS